MKTAKLQLIQKVCLLMVLTLIAPVALANECVATFDEQTATLTIPCIGLAGTVYEVDLGLIEVDVKDFNVKGNCTTNDECASTDYCKKPRGNCGGVGICEARPQSCILIFDPVVGCDGNIYSNFCNAAESGINTLAASPDF